MYRSKSFNYFFKSFLIFIIFLYFFVFSIISVSYFVLPKVKDHNEFISLILEKNSDLDWSIEGMHAEWDWLSPTFYFSSMKAKINKPKKFNNLDELEIFSSSEGYIKLDLLKSIFNLSIRFREIKSDDLTFTLSPSKSFSWDIFSFQDISSTSSYNVLKNFSNLDRVDVVNLNVKILSNTQTKEFDYIHLEPFKVKFKYFNSIRQLSITQKHSNSDTFKFLLQTNGQINDRDFKLNANLKLSQFELTSLLLPFGFDKSSFISKNFTGEASLSKEYKKPWSLRLNISDALIANYEEDDWKISDIGLDLAAEYTDKNNIKLWWKNLHGLWNEEPLDFNSAIILLENKNKILSFKTPRVDIGQISKITNQINLLPKNILSAFDGLNIKGIINNLNVSAPLLSIENAQGSGLLEGFSIQPWKKIPGISNLDAYFNFADRGGLFQIKDLKNFSVHFPQNYKEPLKFNHFSGEIDWSVINSRFLMSSPNINFTFNDVSRFATRFDLNAKTQKDDISTQLSLEVGVRNGSAKKLKNLLPITLNKDLLNWIDKSNIDGSIIDGGFIYNGSTIKGDITKKSTHFYLNMDGGKLFFNPDFPSIQDIDGLWVMNDSILHVDIFSSIFSGINFDNSLFKMNRLDRPASITLQSNLSGTISDAWQVFLKTFIGEKNHSKLKGFNFIGELDEAKLFFKLPLDIFNQDLKRGSEKFRDIRFSNSLSDIKLEQKDLNFFIENINGHISFDTENGLKSNIISASIFDEPLELIFGDASKKNRKPSSKNIYFDAKTSISTHKISEWFGLPVHTIFNGKSYLDMSLDSTPKVSKLTIDSDMNGISINLPGKFRKSKESSAPFKMDWSIKKNDEAININVFDRFKADLKFKDSNFVSGDVIIEKSTHLPSNKSYLTPNTLTFTGTLDQFSINEWLDIYNNYQSERKLMPVMKDSIQSGIDMKFRDLHIKKIKFDKSILPPSIVNLDKVHGRWKIGIENNVFAGIIGLPKTIILNNDEFFSSHELISEAKKLNKDDRLLVNLDYLNIPSVSFQKNKSMSIFSPERWVLADVSIEKIQYKERLFGNWEFLISPSKDKVLFHNINANYDDVIFSSNYEDGLLWSFDPDSGFKTKLNVQVKTKSPSILFSKFDENIKNNSPFDCEMSNLDVSFYWPNIPMDFDLNNSKGSIEFSFNNGSFINTSSPAEGLLKLVSLFNFNAIFDGIDLNLDRIYKDGIQFSSMFGKLDLDRGIVSFEDNPIQVNAPSSRFVLSGFADLKDSKIDSTLVATLPVKDNLPWFAALSGGLPMAAGVYFATKVFDKEIDRLSSAVYQVKGNLNNPEINFDRIFDNDATSR